MNIVAYILALNKLALIILLVALGFIIYEIRVIIEKNKKIKDLKIPEFEGNQNLIKPKLMAVEQPKIQAAQPDKKVLIKKASLKPNLAPLIGGVFVVILIGLVFLFVSVLGNSNLVRRPVKTKAATIKYENDVTIPTPTVEDNEVELASAAKISPIPTQEPKLTQKELNPAKEVAISLPESGSGAWPLYFGVGAVFFITLSFIL